MKRFNPETLADISKILNKHDKKLPIECTIEIAEYVDDKVFHAICDARGDWQMKPSLHELIVNVIETYLYENRNIDITIEESDELAEQIIKIIRDYHLVEDVHFIDRKYNEKENK